MNEPIDNQLKNLLETLFGPQQAKIVGSDIEAGDRILAGNPAPAPDSTLLAAVEAKVELTLAAKRQTYVRKVWLETISAAAAVLIIAALIRQFSSIPPAPAGKPVLAEGVTESIWAGSDSELITLTAAADELEQEMFTAQADDNGNGGSVGLAELELELEQIDSDFWKG